MKIHYSMNPVPNFMRVHNDFFHFLKTHDGSLIKKLQYSFLAKI